MIGPTARHWLPHPQERCSSANELAAGRRTDTRQRLLPLTGKAHAGSTFAGAGSLYEVMGPDDFDRFVGDNSDGLLRTASLMVGDLHEAEDLVQETLFKVAARWPRVSRMDNPVAYARRILVNLALHGSSKRSRRRAELKATPPAETAAPAGPPRHRRPAIRRTGGAAATAARRARAPLLPRALRGGGSGGAELLGGDRQEQHLPWAEATRGARSRQRPAQRSCRQPIAIAAPTSPISTFDSGRSTPAGRTRSSSTPAPRQLRRPTTSAR
jgi:Sigma-70 region 2